MKRGSFSNCLEEGLSGCEADAVEWGGGRMVLERVKMMRGKLRVMETWGNLFTFVGHFFMY